MTDTIRCKNPECSNIILVSTAERTNGFCMPCVQAQSRMERADFIRKNRRDLNEFKGVTDLVEVLKIIHRPRKFDPLINWIPYEYPTDYIYTQLCLEDQVRLAKYAEGLIVTERNTEAESIILCLAAFTEVPVDDCLRKLIAQGCFWPSLAFCRAGNDVRDDLIALVGKDDVILNGILLALAWIGDEAVVNLFNQWRLSPPSWSKSLYIPPQNYSREAGWELTEKGKRRDLYFSDCTKLVGGSSNAHHNFTAITPGDDQCPWCGQYQTYLIDFVPSEFGVLNYRDSSSRVRVTTCEICTVFTTVFGEFNESGQSQWHASNIRPEYLADDPENWNILPQNSLSPAGKRSPLFAASEFLPTTFSQIGGHPTWIQDAEYPQCPSCAKTMMFLAQIDRDNIEDHSEGIYYICVCNECKVSATLYQQS